jgi:hypothetical protein
MFPKEIENLIYEFNVDHREMMKPVLTDILSVKKCMCCEGAIRNANYLSRGFYFCSVSCYTVVRPGHVINPYMLASLLYDEVV